MWTQLALNMRMVQHFIYVAAANLGVSAAQVLLNFGADLNLVDDLAHKAHNCIPEMVALLEFQVLIAFFYSRALTWTQLALNMRMVPHFI